MDLPAASHRRAESSPTEPTSAPPFVCPASGVSFRDFGHDAALGLRVMSIELLNCGTADVALDGYPSVGVLDDFGSALTVTIKHGMASFDAPLPRAFVVPPGCRASASIVWRNTCAPKRAPLPGEDEDGDIDQAVGVYLAVATADGATYQRMQPQHQLDLGSAGAIDVTAWTDIAPC